MVPPSPTAVPLFASMKETAHRVCVVPLAWIVQLFPPSVVLTIAPYSPTMVPVFASTKEAPRRLFPCGRGFCQCHCAPDEPPCAFVRGDGRRPASCLSSMDGEYEPAGSCKAQDSQRDSRICHFHNVCW